jgi:hypothetical protein
MRRLLLLLTLLGVPLGLGLLAPAPAKALSMQVVSSNVFVDVFTRAENLVSDRPARSGPNLEQDTGVSVYVAPLQSATGVANAQSGRRPFVPRPRELELQSKVEVEARTKASVEAEAESIGGGSVRIQILGSLSEAPAAALSFAMSLSALSQPGIDWDFQFSVFNETRGIQVFATAASDESPIVPTDFLTPANFGDILRVDWRARIYAFGSGGNSSQGSLDFGTSITALPIPEAQPMLPLLAGLTALAHLRRRRAAAGR